MKSIVDALVPPDTARCAKRVGTVSLVLAACVWKLFPAAAAIGTAVDADRSLLAIALA